MLNKKLIVRRNETAHVLSERSVLIKMLNHPYLVQLHFAFTTAHKIFFVLDYVNGGEVSVRGGGERWRRGQSDRNERVLKIQKKNSRKIGKVYILHTKKKKVKAMTSDKQTQAYIDE